MFKNPYRIGLMLSTLIAASVAVGLHGVLPPMIAICCGFVASSMSTMLLLPLMPRWRAVLELIERVCADDGLQPRFRWAVGTESGRIIVSSTMLDFARSILENEGKMLLVPTWVSMEKMPKDDFEQVKAMRDLLEATSVEEPGQPKAFTPVVGLAKMRPKFFEKETGPSFVFTNRRGFDGVLPYGTPTHLVVIAGAGCQRDDEGKCDHTHHGMIFPQGSGIFGVSREMAQRIANLGPGALGFANETILVGMSPMPVIEENSGAPCSGEGQESVSRDTMGNHG